MDNKISTILIICVLVCGLFFVSGCTNNKENELATGNAITNLNGTAVDKIEVYHFHATNQCYSCKTVGAYAEETINTYFSEELKSGKIIFNHINIDLPENAELVSKYNVTGASLWIGVYDKNGFHAEENVNVWYKIRDKEDYVSYLKNLIETRLSGNLN